MFGKPHSYLGVDLGSDGVKVVELKKQKNRPVLHTYAYSKEPNEIHDILTHDKESLNIEDGLQKKFAQDEKKQDKNKKQLERQVEDKRIEKYAGLLKSVCAQAKTTSKTAVVSLPVSGVFHVVVTLPKVKKEDFNIVLQSEMKKIIPMDLSKVTVDYQVIETEDKKTQKILVNAVEKTKIAFYSKVFKKAGLVLDSLEPESTALSRALVGNDKSLTMMVDVGAVRSNFFIFENGYPMTHNSLESGGNKIDKILQNRLGVDDKMVEQIKYDLSDSLKDFNIINKNQFLDMMAPVIDPIIKEIEYSFELYSRQIGNENKVLEKIILTGGASMIPYLSEYISDKFKVKSFVGDPWARIIYQDSLKVLLDKISPRMSVAIGLALRKFV